jgi:hypothetical protein
VLIFCHLFTGLVLGLLLFRYSGQRWTFWACALGSVLPDILDKPLGHIFLHGTLDNGRLYAHSLLFLGVICLAGVLLWKRRGSYLLLALAAGVLLHQLADTMYLDQIAWLWPLFGPFQPESFPDYFGQSIIIELTSAYEWVFGLASMAIILQQLRSGGWQGWHALMHREGGLTMMTWGLFLSAILFVLYGMAISGTEDFGNAGALYIAAIAAVAGGLGIELAYKK